MTSPTIAIINIKPQAIQLFLFSCVAIALFLLATTTNLLQQQDQFMASVEQLVDGEAFPNSKLQLQISSEVSLKPNLIMIKDESISLRKSLLADYQKLFPQKADVIRGDVPLISSSDKGNLKLAEEPVQKKSQSRRIKARSVLQSDDQARLPAASTATLATTAGKNLHVDDSVAFHVDYSGPKTHPPKNN